MKYCELRPDGTYDPADIEDCLRRGVADMRMAGLICTDEEIDLVRRYMSGGLTRDEYMAKALALAGEIST